MDGTAPSRAPDPGLAPGGTLHNARNSAAGHLGGWPATGGAAILGQLDGGAPWVTRRPHAVGAECHSDPVSTLLAVTVGDGWAAFAGPGGPVAGGRDEVVRRAIARAAELSRHGPLRWVWWSAREVVPQLLTAGARIDRSWDVAEVHRLLAGGWRADSASAWALVAGLDLRRSPRPAEHDLFDFVTEPGPAPYGEHVSRPGWSDGIGATGAESPVRADGYLRPEAVSGQWQSSPARAAAWAMTLLAVAARQEVLLSDTRRRHTAWSESAAAVLCVELEREGLPLDRARAETVLTDLIGPRPRDDAEAARLRALRDARVTQHVPGREGIDLRSPEQIRGLLAAVGIDVPDTRKHRLLTYRDSHPVVAALLEWRAAERVATTYGYRWLDEHVGADGRLRGRWTACDGAAGRMTAQNGLHNLPAVLRLAVAAEPGHVLVRADLGQVEPRVLAAVSGDPAFLAATQAPDLYAPVAMELGLDRSSAKVAVLAAMYGQTSGAAGEALRRLTRSYPVAVAYLDRAYEAGLSGAAIRTYGGRRVAAADGPPGTGTGPDVTGPDAAAAAEQGRARARGRFLRNAAIQGAAAELFKAWAATVRGAIRPLGADLVLALHDELLIHSPTSQASRVAEAVDGALRSAAARWAEGSGVRFVADVSIVATWADAKG